MHQGRQRPVSHVVARLPSAFVDYPWRNRVAGFCSLRPGRDVHGPELLVDVLPRYPGAGPVIGSLWVLPEEDGEDCLVVRVRQHGTNRAVRERNISRHLPTERGADIRIQPRREGEGGHAELLRSPGEIEGELCARVFPGYLRELIPDRFVYRREDHLPGEWDGERCRDLLDGRDRIPDREARLLDFLIGRDVVEGAVRENVRSG